MLLGLVSKVVITGYLLRNATGMSTGAGLNAQWQFSETGGKVNQHNTYAKQCSAEQVWCQVDAWMPRAVMIYRKGQVACNTLCTPATLFLTVRTSADLEVSLPRKVAW